MIVDKDKKEKIEKLVRSFRELDGAMIPFQEQKKELRSNYIENGWLTKDEFTLCKKAYNNLKNKVNMDELLEMIEICKKEVP